MGAKKTGTELPGSRRVGARGASTWVAVLAALGVALALLGPATAQAVTTYVVSGEVVLPAEVDPSTVTVAAMQEVTEDDTTWWNPIEESPLTPSGATWTYTLAVPAGSYVIRVQDYAGVANQVFLPDADHAFWATPVEVAADTQVPSVTLTRQSSVAGIVTTPAGHARTAVRVDAYRLERGAVWGSEPVSSASVDEDGAYRVGQLPPGTYRLHFVDPDLGVASGWWAGAGNAPVETLSGATDVVVAHSVDLDNHDVTLQRGGTITGRVTDLAGAPVDSPLRVYAYEPWANDLTQLQWRSVLDVAPGTDGTFRLEGLQPGRYRVGAVPETDASPWGPVFHGGGSSPDTGADVVVRAGVTTTGILLKVDRPGTVHGTVRLPQGAVAGKVGVTLWARSATGTWVETSWYTPLDAEGTYTFVQVPSGTYRVGFHDAGGVAARRFHPDARTVETAADVVLGNGRYDLVVDATLPLRSADVVPEPPTPKPTPKITVRTKAKVSGKAKVGRTLKVSRGTYSPAAVTVKYRWWVRTKSGKVVRIKGATTSKLKLRKAWTGRKVRATVTVSRAGHRGVVVTTGWSKKIKR